MTMSSPQTTGSQTAGLHAVIPAYQAEATLAHTVSSLRRQPGPPVPVIICDDGSRDATLQRAKEMAAEDRLITVLTGPNRGACAARNMGLAHAQAHGAQAVLFLDADDEIAGDYLAPAAAQIAAGADLVLSPMMLRMPDGTQTEQSVPQDLAARGLFASWLSGPHLVPAAMVWRVAFVQEIGGWDETILINQDGDLAMRAFAAGAHAVANHAGHGIYNIGNPASLSSQHSNAKLANYVQNLQRLRDLGLDAVPALDVGAIEDTLYGVARMCFAAGFVDTGREAVAALHAMGRAHHRGSLAHRVAAGLLGLERKVQLSKAVMRKVRG